jgi:uncharacterized protein YcbK (DUF882 family)
MRLTANFSTESDPMILHKGLSWAAVPEAHQRNLIAIVNRLQVLRDLLGKPITITSGYRTWAYHESLYKRLGVQRQAPKSSKHLTGEALDFNVQGMTPQQVQKYLHNWSGGLGFGKDFTHIDLGPKRRWDY